MRSSLLSVLLLAFSTFASAQAKPEELPEVTAASLDASIRRGVDFLVTHQNPNGSWGRAARTKGLNIYAPLPGAHHAYRAGASGLALSGIIDAADPRPEVEAAIAKAAVWTTAELPKLRRAYSLMALAWCRDTLTDRSFN